MHIRRRANVILLYSAVTRSQWEERLPRWLKSDNRCSKKSHTTRGNKWNTNFIFASFIKMITPAFGDNLLHIKFTKVSVNIKVQRICLPVRARLLKVHATSTPNPVSREESSHLPFYLIYTNVSHFQLVKRKNVIWSVLIKAHGPLWQVIVFYASWLSLCENSAPSA